MTIELVKKTSIREKKIGDDAFNYAKNVFCSFKKIRPLLDLIKGQNVARALHILSNCSKKKYAAIITKGIDAAMANGINNKNFIKENLYLGTTFANKGRTIKRLFPRAKGSSNVRYKHVCNVYIGLKNQTNIIKEGV